MTEIAKFPTTPHLAWLGREPIRPEKVLSPDEVAAFLQGEVTVEEKVDGANVGISFSDDGEVVARNRSRVLTPKSHAQFQPLWAWLAARHDKLHRALEKQLVVYGEWCFARHSCKYDRLPDWFLAFDVYDRARNAFWSADRRDALCHAMGLRVVPRIARGRFSLATLIAFLESQSALGPEKVEGVYVRAERADELRARAKLVRPEFLDRLTDHWLHRPLERNHVVGTCSDALPPARD